MTRKALAAALCAAALLPVTTPRAVAITPPQAEGLHANSRGVERSDTPGHETHRPRSPKDCS